MPKSEREIVAIEKTRISIPEEYQRRLSIKRVRKIAATFDWGLFGVLTVMVRDDGSYWVADGQHRLLAANMISTIYAVPCILRRSTGVAFEARNFLDANALRAVVPVHDRYKAGIVAEDAVCLRADAALARNGYSVARSGGTPYSMRSPALLTKMFAVDEVAANATVDFCCTLYGGEPLAADTMSGAFLVARAVPAAITREHGDRMAARGGRDMVESEIRKASYAMGRGEKAFAAGVLKAINRSMRKKYSATF